MREAKRKILVAVVVVLVVLAAPYISMAHAGKGQTKQYFELYLEGYSAPGPDTKMWFVDGDIFHAKGFSYIATFMEVTVGEDTITPVGYSCIMDTMINFATGHGTIRVSESIVFADGGTLEIQTAEMLHNYGTPDGYGEGSFIGHGTGSLEGVKVQGTTYMANEIPNRIGTVMGWP